MQIPLMQGFIGSPRLLRKLAMTGKMSPALVVHSGYILIVVLVFLQMLSLTSLTIMGQITQTLHVQKVLEHSEKSFALARRAVTYIENRRSLRCLIPVTPVQILKTKSLRWWQSHACTGQMDGRAYFYVQESLGVDLCAVDQTGHIAHYYRVTVVLTAKERQDMNVFVQSTWINSLQSRDECHEQRHLITPGEQMYRIID